MSGSFCVLSSELSVASDQALCKLAHLLGLQTELIPLSGELAAPPAELLKTTPPGRLMAFGAPLLKRLYERDWFATLLDATHFIFVYGFTPADSELPELKWLTGKALSSVIHIRADSKKFTVASEGRFGGFPVSGRSYTVESVPAAAFCAMKPGASIESCISVNENPYCVGISRGQSVVFLLAEPELVDIEKVLLPKLSLRRWYAQLIAVTIILRSTFGDCCWKSPVTGATFIVDDPYLKWRYGCMHYKTLVRELENAHAALTIAFIPYNFLRSDPRVIEFLKGHADRFSIAVHGCDHTGGEFASLDEEWLASRATCALDRMEAHSRFTNMPFDNVMVFPQGRFSTRALSALKSCGFDAAVNSSPWPEDGGDTPLTLGDLLQVAVTRYDTFPIFIRRYPGEIFDYAFDILFQKPVLAVEHHGFFRRGCEPLGEFVRDVSAVVSNLSWMPLAQTVTSSCVLRRTGNRQSVLRHFAPVLRFKNRTPEKLSLTLEKPEQDGLVEAVLVGNRRVPFEVNSGFVKYAANLDPDEELNVTILHRRTHRPKRTPSWQYRFAASARRVLSDFRDNYLA